jgi:hypothetical protein
MASVRVMKMAFHEVVHMIAVGHGFMAALGAVHVVFRVSVAGMSGRTGRRVRRRDLQRVLVEMVAVRGVQMPVVEVVDVIPVLDGGVPAVVAVDVRMVVVDRVPHSPDQPTSSMPDRRAAWARGRAGRRVK